MNRYVFITADTHHCQYVNMKTGITTSINVSMTNLSLAVFLTLLLTPRDIQARTHKHIRTCIILKHIAVSKIHFTQPSCCQLSLGSTAGERRMQWQPFSVNTIGHACLWILKYKKTPAWWGQIMVALLATVVIHSSVSFNSSPAY